MKRAATEEVLRCSFCHKQQDVVAKLISSPSDYPRAYICDKCIAVCASILNDDQGIRGVRCRTNQRSVPLLVDAVYCWMTADTESEQRRLAEVRRIVEHMFFQPELDAALALPAGAELDAVVAAKIFPGVSDDQKKVVPAYSKDITAAWSIVEPMASIFGGHAAGDGWFYLQFAEHADHGESDREAPCDTSLRYRQSSTGDWSAHFHLNYVRPGSAFPSHWGNRDKFCARSETAALAICRAALKAYW
jgi:hypothetical protein